MREQAFNVAVVKAFEAPRFLDDLSVHAHVNNRFAREPSRQQAQRKKVSDIRGIFTVLPSLRAAFALGRSFRLSALAPWQAQQVVLGAVYQKISPSRSNS